MSHPTESRTRLGAVRSYPFDMALASLLAVTAYLLVTSLPIGSELRLAAALPLVLFLPGYALVSVLFPAAAEPDRERTAGGRLGQDGIDWIERLSLSFATSLVVATVVAMALAATEWGLTAETSAIALGGATIVLAQLGAIRRLRVPETDRFRVSLRGAFARTRRSTDEGVIAAASTLLLAACVVTAFGVIGFAIVSPQTGASYTELGVFTETEDGELVADDYPAELEPGESASLTAAVENHQGEEETYVLVVQQQRLEDGEVVDRTRLDRHEAVVADGATEHIEHELEPEAEGETVRVTYLLYQDAAPENPTMENAEEDVFIWVTVTGPGAAEETDGE